MVEIGNSIYRFAGQERDYGRAKTTKTKAQSSQTPSTALSTGQRALSPRLEKLNTCAQNLGLEERKYGNPARTPSAPASPAPEWGRSGERGRSCTRPAILGSSGEARKSQGSACIRGGAGAAGSGADLL